MAKRKFTKHFREYACDGDTLSIELPHGMTAIATIHHDDDDTAPDERQDGYWPSLDPKSAGYIGNKSRRTLERQTVQAQETMDAWKRGEWWFVGVAVTIEKDGVLLTGLYDHALWGIECNYPKHGNWRVNRYLRDVANELLPEAIEAATAKIEKLAA